MSRLVRRVTQEIVFGAWRGLGRPRARAATARLFTGADLRVVLPEPTACDLWLDGRIEHALTRLISRSLRSGRTFVDVGAHYGYFTLVAADAVGPYGRVFAFEPDPARHELLRANAAKLVQVRCERIAPSLDDYMTAQRRRVHALRLDAPGTELEILRTAERVLTEDAPLVALAGVRDGSHQTSMHWLTSLGYWPTSLAGVFASERSAMRDAVGPLAKAA